MKNYIKIFVPFTLAILIGSITFAFAQTSPNADGKSRTDGRGKRPMPPGGGEMGLHPRMLEQINLTDAQKEQITAIQTASRDASKDNFDKVRGYDEQLKTLVEGGSFDEAQARTILSNKAQTMIEHDLVRLRADAAIYKILTAEQKAQLEQLKQQRPEPPQRGSFRPEERRQN